MKAGWAQPTGGGEQKQNMGKECRKEQSLEKPSKHEMLLYKGLRIKCKAGKGFTCDKRCDLVELQVLVGQTIGLGSH